MTSMLKRRCPRKAAWLAFSLLVLATLSTSTQHTSETTTIESPEIPSTAPSVEVPLAKGQVSDEHSNSTPQSQRQENDHAVEATRAYKQALATLTILTAQPPLRSQEPSFTSISPSTNPILSYFLPNLQGQGPLGTAFRILVKLHQQSWLTRLTSGFAKEGLGIGSKRKEDEMRGKAIKVVDLLQLSAELGNSDALYTLAQLYMFPPNTYFNSDPKLAYESYSLHASTTGNASSQAILAFFHSSGYHNVVPVDQAKAQLYYTFAASGGHKGAQMALGYRYWSGIGALEDCTRAMEWYEQAAEQAMAKFLSGPPGGRTLPHTATRLSDLEGGVFGPGASVASTGLNAIRPAIKAGVARAAGETWEDVLEYYLFNADRGETDFAYRLGKIFYQGSIYGGQGGIASGSDGVGAIPRDFARARYYFLRIARQVWPRDPPNPAHYQPAPVKEGPREGVGYAAASAAYLGRMYLRGEGVKADAGIAKMWFERGAEYADKECHNGLGIIWRDGLVGRVDNKKAMLNFMIAAGKDLAEAQINVGKHHHQRKDYQVASKYFEAAMRNGSPFEAYYYLGEIQAGQVRARNAPPNIKSSSCAMAVSFYKLVAERGVWEDDPSRDAEIGWLNGSEQSQEIAILKWWIAAERGSETAQNNLAYVLDQDRSLLRLTRFSPFTPSNETARLALTQWIRSAGQRNIDALVKVGDYYYHGLGMDEDATSRLEKAAKYYQSAADTQLSALAMWNLGWMYENGIGVPQDFHLAKRHYDLALETNPDAYLAVFLSLTKLYVRSIWHTLLGGQGGLNIWNPQEEEATAAASNKPQDNRELPDSETRSSAQSPSEVNQDEREQEDDDGPWYLGKAREELFRRRRHGTGRQGGDDDPIQWARERRNADPDREGEYGADDYYDGALRRGEDDDELGETMLLVVLCLSVSILLYVRTRLMDQVRRDQHPQQQQQGQQPGQPQNGNAAAAAPPNPGAFPPPGDPARDAWLIQH